MAGFEGAEALQINRELPDTAPAMFRARYPIHRPMPTATANALTPVADLDAIAGSRTDRDAQFENQLRETRIGLRIRVKDSVFQHPMYEFVRRVSGATGIAAQNPMLGFDTVGADRDAEVVLSSLRRIHQLETSLKDTAYASEQRQARLRAAQDAWIRADQRRERWSRQLTRESAFLFNYWRRIQNGVISESAHALVLLKLFPPVSDIMKKLVFQRPPLTPSDEDILKTVQDLGLVPADPLWRALQRELYPLHLGGKRADQQYDLGPNTPNDRGLAADLDAYLERNNVFPTTAPPPSAPSYTDTRVGPDLDETLDETFDETFDDEDAVVVTTDAGTIVDSESLRAATASLVLSAGNEDATMQHPQVAFFPYTARRALVVLVGLPALLCAGLLGRLLGGGGSTDAADNDILVNHMEALTAAFVVIRETVEATPSGLQSAVSTLNALAQHTESVLRTTHVVGDSDLASSVWEALRQSILEGHTSFVIPEEDNESAAPLRRFLLFLMSEVEAVESLTEQWRETLTPLYAVAGEDAEVPALDTVLTAAVATDMYRRFFMFQRSELVSAAAYQHRVYDEARQSPSITTANVVASPTERAVEAEKQKIAAALERLEDEDGVGVSPDIVQALDLALAHVHETVRGWRHLKHAENIALTPTETVAAAFAHLVQLKRRVAQIEGGFAGYIQNAQLPRLKVAMAGAIGIMRRYAPLDRVGGLRGGYRFQGRTSGGLF